MGRERGWVSVSVRTYHSHRSQQQQQNQSRVMQQDYTVDESGATLNAVSRSSDASEEQQLMQQMAAAANSNAPTTSIFIRDWKVRPSTPPPPLHLCAPPSLGSSAAASCSWCFSAFVRLPPLAVWLPAARRPASA